MTSLIRVSTAWNDWRTVELPFEDLDDFRWLQPPGTARTMMHAYVRCSEVVRGLLPHHCPADSPVHRLLVCILRHDVDKDTYAEVARRAAVISDRRRTHLAVYEALTPSRRVGSGDRRQSS